MLRKLGGTMTGHDFLHHLLLHKSPRPIARHALLIRKKLFNGVVIQRGHVVLTVKTTSRVPPRRAAAAQQHPERHYIRAIERARCGSRPPSQFVQSAWRSSAVLFLFPRSVLLPARRHIDLGIVP